MIALEKSARAHVVDAHTQELVRQMNNLKTVRYYRGMEFIVYPRVFFPLPHSSSLKGITKKDIAIYNGKRVLDVGCGTGLWSVIAALSGAQEVTAVDNNSDAINNTYENCRKYKLTDKIKIVESDLFNNVSGTYDVIIGYLPIVPRAVDAVWQYAVFDPDFLIHQRFFHGVKNYLAKNGIIKMVHASKGDSPSFEAMVREHELIIDKKTSSQKFGHTWHFYNLKLQ
ncbi:MAG: hypothetical protein RL557_706 [archaeon]|jgi:methylase of polypeptide subunit release factors